MVTMDKKRTLTGVDNADGKWGRENAHLQRETAAFHEAGHAVAAVMRGGSTLLSVTLSTGTHGAGITWVRHKVWDLAFLTFAGPWAEARYEWAKIHDDLAVDDISTSDHECEVFEDWVCGVFLSQPDDMRTYREAGAGDVIREGIWHRELEAVWPAVVRVAERLLAGDVTHDEVEAFVTEAWVSLIDTGAAALSSDIGLPA